MNLFSKHFCLFVFSFCTKCYALVMITKMISLEKWAACATIIVTEGVEIRSLVSLSNWLKRTGFLSIFQNTLLETNARVQISDFTRIIVKNLRHFRPVSLLPKHLNHFI